MSESLFDHLSGLGGDLPDVFEVASSRKPEEPGGACALVQKITNTAELPVILTDGSWRFFADKEIGLKQGEHTVSRLGIRVKLPDGHKFFVQGQQVKSETPVLLGIIDAGPAGIIASFYNPSDTYAIFSPGESVGEAAVVASPKFRIKVVENIDY